VYLAVSLAAGVLQLSSPAAGRLLWPTYVHLLVLGWLTQLIFGVALWMFPRRPRETAGVHAGLGWSCYWLLNLGLLLRAVGEPARALGRDADAVLAGAAALQLAAGWIFVILVWPRVKER
jgi:hypothetical protein